MCHVWWRAMVKRLLRRTKLSSTTDQSTINELNSHRLAPTTNQNDHTYMTKVESFTIATTRRRLDSTTIVTLALQMCGNNSTWGSAGNRPILSVGTSSVLWHQILLNMPIGHKACLAIIHSICQIHTSLKQQKSLQVSFC